MDAAKEVGDFEVKSFVLTHNRQFFEATFISWLSITCFLTLFT
jgi:hypothetical protein